MTPINPSGKKKKALKILQPVFAKGDCVTFKLANDKYGGAVVLEAIYDTQFGHNLIAATRIDQPNKPTINDFKNSTVLVLNFAMWKDSPNIHWYSPIRHKNVEHLVEVVAQLKVDKTYTYYNGNATTFGFCADFEVWIIDGINRQLEFELTNKKSEKIIKIKELTNIRKWKFW